MPETKPSTSARNFTPTSMAPGSFWLTTAGTVASGQMLHGHTPGTVAVAVRKVLLTGAIRLPASSRAPRTATV